MIFKQKIASKLNTYSNINYSFIDDFIEFNRRDILIITSNMSSAKRIFNNIKNDNKILYLSDELLNQKVIAENEEIKLVNAEFYEKITTNQQKIIISNLLSLNHKHPTIEKIQEGTLNYQIGDFFDILKVSNKLSEMGYNRVDVVNDIYQYAIRGFVLDICLNADEAFRIVIDEDNVIEEIKVFDLNNQITISQEKEIIINSLILSDQSVYFDEYLTNPLYVLIDIEQISKKLEMLLEQNINIVSIDQIINKATQLNFNFGDNYLDIKAIDNVDQRVINEVVSGNKPVVFNVNKNNLKLLDKFLNKYNIISSYEFINNNIPNVIYNGYDESFIYEGIYYLNLNKKETVLTTPTNDSKKITIIPGDYIVHEKYGIGKFEGLHNLKVKGAFKEYLKIKYANTDVLYVPVEKISYVKKYAGIEGFAPKLNKLNSNEWSKTKKYIKEHLKVVADEIIKLAAERKRSKGIKFNLHPEEEIFWHNCPFELTEDQAKVWAEVKYDMESSMPMDRLVCGDVGFGKTEVAFRAIFKAIINGYQALYICPTTILAKQQYLKAIERFKYFGINIELYDRSINEKGSRIIETKLAEGKIDLLIGTHRVLSEKINFKKIGLIVVDEEQRFGVNFKEKIKKISIVADLLTLSATPIPRTLQMSLAGLKDFSLINTPPFDRMAVLTYVLNYNLFLIKEIIENELERSGQVFYLQNRIDQMEQTMANIKKMMPGLRIALIHGRMSKEKADTVIAKFLEKEYDLLMATTIIETGIDMPNVNTIIVENADMLGLSQLYQLRGRVGRSNKQAYAYLLVEEKPIKDEAVARLKTIKDFTALGSGIDIARRDLAIRGAGNILGREQAGFINSIGIDLYNQFLEKEINKLKGLEVDETIYEKPLLNIETDVLSKYIYDDRLRIDIHQLINTIDSRKNYQKIKNELIDRLGKIDDKVDIYLKSVWFEKIARLRGVIEIDDDNLKWYIKTNNKQALNKISEYKMLDQNIFMTTIYKKNLKTIDQFIDLVDLEGEQND